MSKIVDLGNPDGVNCAVSTVGATVMSCTYQNTSMIYPLHLRADGKNRGGVPICFPYFGPPHPDYDNDMVQHGWLRDQAFSITLSCLPYSVLMEGLRCPVGITSYPWSLAYHVFQIVHDRMLQTHLTFRKICDPAYGKAPVNPGFHHYFPNDGKTEVLIGDRCYTQFSADAKCVILKPDDVIIINTGKLSIYMILAGFNYETCVYLWSDDPQKYFCVEPVLMPREKFETEEGYYLADDEVKEMSVTLRVL